MELASYDPSLSAGMNLTYAGTQLTDGEPASGSACITGFDQAGFIMGTSGSFSSVSTHPPSEGPLLIPLPAI